MIRKELATVIGLSVALSVTGCRQDKAVVEEPKTDVVEEAKEEETADTTAPKINVKDNIVPVELGSKIKALDYVDTEDESDVSVYFVTENGDQINIDVPTEIKSGKTDIDCIIVAVDAMSNRSEEIKVKIPINVPEEAERKDIEEATKAEKVKSEFDIEQIPETTYYATQTCNVRSGPSTTYDIVRQLQPNEEIIVNGKVKAPNGKNWCVIKTDDGSIQMVSGSLINTEKIAQSKPSEKNNKSDSTKGTTGSTSNSDSKSKPSSTSKSGSTANITPSDCDYSDCDYGDCDGDCITYCSQEVEVDDSEWETDWNDYGPDVIAYC